MDSVIHFEVECLIVIQNIQTEKIIMHHLFINIVKHAHSHIVYCQHVMKSTPKTHPTYTYSSYKQM